MASQIDKVVAAHYSGGWGVELAIYKGGVPLYVRGYGQRDRGLPDSFGGYDFWHVRQPSSFLEKRGDFVPDASTVFDLASVSKCFTAGAILLLQQDGRLSVSDPLSKYFPSLPGATRIPLLYLLQHRSGLVDYTTFGQYPDFTEAYKQFHASGNRDYQSIVARLAAFPLRFTPGTRYEYSNTNYLLLGMIVAQRSGEPLETFLKNRIFRPLGMTHTHQAFPKPPVDDLALGYANVGAGPQRTWQPNLQWLAGPGGLTSTVGDIEKWDRAVRGPGLFDRKSLKQMFSPSPFPQSYGTYADGWFISSLDGRRYIWHDGKISGYQTMNAMFPDDGIEIVILTNDGSGTDPFFIVPQLLPIVLNLGSSSASAVTRRYDD
jgi:D-alanyl-D-alanine carboxypeptidase